MRTCITLTNEQMERARKVAQRLHDSLRRKGVKDGHGLRENHTGDLEWTGAAGELAASLLLGLPWTASMDSDPFGPDIGKRTQVRSSGKSRIHHSLIIRQRDLDKYGDVPFVLVIRRENTFSLLGWLMASEATCRGRWWDGGQDRPPAWFVSQRDLENMESYADRC